MRIFQWLLGKPPTLAEYMASIEHKSTFTTCDGKTHTLRYYGDKRSHREWNRRNRFDEG